MIFFQFMNLGALLKTLNLEFLSKNINFEKREIS